MKITIEQNGKKYFVEAEEVKDKPKDTRTWMHRVAELLDIEDNEWEVYERDEMRVDAVHDASGCQIVMKALLKNDGYFWYDKERGLRFRIFDGKMPSYEEFKANEDKEV